MNDLATSYECSDDGLTWTFTIRDDVKFTDGEPLTAHDVAFTVMGVATSTAGTADLTMVESAEATDDTTVVITLTKPFNALLYTLAVVGIVPEHAYGPDYGANPIGSGRYMLEQWDRGQQVILKANPDYYGEAHDGPRDRGVHGGGRLAGRRAVGPGRRGLHLGRLCRPRTRRLRAARCAPRWTPAASRCPAWPPAAPRATATWTTPWATT